jgi:hypothetical protein
MSDAELSVPVPLDGDGFLRRACPACTREFKWLPSDESEPTPAAGYACPYCAGRADADWLTEAQLAVVADAAGDEVASPILDEFAADIRRMNRPGSLLRFDVEVSRREPRPPLTEPNDMLRVDPPCHPKEPIKVAEDWTGVVHCLICAAPIRGRRVGAALGAARLRRHGVHIG